MIDLKIILIFFAYTIFTGVLNNLYLQSENLENYYIIIKTFLYLRFLIFYLVIRVLINENIIDFKSFFILCFICTYFVSLDLIYQLNFGQDIFGYISTDPRRLSGPFGDELIAGSYLQRFSLFALLLFPIFFNNKSKIYLYLLLFRIRFQFPWFYNTVFRFRYTFTYDYDILYVLLHLFRISAGSPTSLATTGSLSRFTARYARPRVTVSVTVVCTLTHCPFFPLSFLLHR